MENRWRSRLAPSLRLLGRSVARALAGAIIAGVLTVLAIWGLQRVGPRLFLGGGHPDPVPLFIYDMATLTTMLPALVPARARDLLLGRDGGADIFWYACGIDRGEYLVAWMIVGALVGLAWPVLRRRARLLLRLVMTVSAVVVAFVGVLAIERATFSREPGRLPPAPASYQGPTRALPEGVVVEELNGFPPAEPTPKGDTPADGGSGEGVLATQDVDDRTYEIVEHRDEWGPWQYTVVLQEGLQPPRALGPFLPGLCGQGFTALDLAAAETFVRAGRMEWIVRESDDDFRVAHKRRPTAAGRTWRCSVPLAAYERDADADGLTEMEETALLTRPDVADTDGDGTPDGNDSSPHGWYRGSQGEGGLVRDLLSAEPEAVGGRFEVVSADSFNVLDASNGPLQVNGGRTVWMTLSSEDQRLFRVRAGVGRSWTFCSVWSDAQEIFLFGHLALTDLSFASHGLAGRGYLVGAYRWPGGRWRPLFSWLAWMS